MYIDENMHEICCYSYSTKSMDGSVNLKQNDDSPVKASGSLTQKNNKLKISVLGRDLICDGDVHGERYTSSVLDCL